MKTREEILEKIKNLKELKMGMSTIAKRYLEMTIDWLEWVLGDNK